MNKETVEKIKKYLYRELETDNTNVEINELLDELENDKGDFMKLKLDDSNIIGELDNKQVALWHVWNTTESDDRNYGVYIFASPYSEPDKELIKKAYRAEYDDSKRTNYLIDNGYYYVEKVSTIL